MLLITTLKGRPGKNTGSTKQKPTNSQRDFNHGLFARCGRALPKKLPKNVEDVLQIYRQGQPGWCYK